MKCVCYYYYYYYYKDKHPARLVGLTVRHGFWVVRLLTTKIVRPYLGTPPITFWRPPPQTNSQARIFLYKNLYFVLIEKLFNESLVVSH